MRGDLRDMESAPNLLLLNVKRLWSYDFLIGGDTLIAFHNDFRTFAEEFLFSFETIQLSCSLTHK